MLDDLWMYDIVPLASKGFDIKCFCEFRDDRSNLESIFTLSLSLSLQLSIYRTIFNF